MPVRSVFAAAALGAGLVQPLAADVRNGSYNGDQCGLGYRNELALDIRWPEVFFYESQCSVTGRTPVAGLQDTFVYSATCRGEGEVWTRSFLLVSDFSGGVTLVQDGFAETYRFCAE